LSEREDTPPRNQKRAPAKPDKSPAKEKAVPTPVKSIA
jgi:hypothetical protein